MFVSTLNVCLVPVEARRECLPRKKQDKGRGRGKGRRENKWRGTQEEKRQRVRDK